MEDGLIQNAATHFARGEYQLALDIYLSFLEKGSNSSDLYYNIGTCYYQLNELPLARWYFEKGLILNPYDSSIQNNLNLVESMVGISNEILFKNLSELIFQNISGLMTSFYWAMLFIVFSWIFMVSVFKQKRIWTYLLLIVMVVVLFFGWYKNQLEHSTHYGIIMGADELVEVRISPDIQSPKINEIKPGRKIIVEETLGEWVKVWIDGETDGWIHQNSIKKL
jgi:tetratricopeptide (TPR) repeat protein